SGFVWSPAWQETTRPPWSAAIASGTGARRGEDADDMGASLNERSTVRANCARPAGFGDLGALVFRAQLRGLLCVLSQSGRAWETESRAMLPVENVDLLDAMRSWPVA